MARKQGLGKGLDALLAGIMEQSNVEKPHKNVDNTVSTLPIHCLVPGKYQPRTSIAAAELGTLADSIRAQGIIQPIVVRPLDAEHYEIIAGERRFRAAGMAGLTAVPVVIKELQDEAAMVIALIENIQRENLSPLEEALALERLSKEFHLTHTEVAEAVGKSRAAVTNLLRLLTLSEDVKSLLARGDIEVGHAKALLTLKEPQQLELAAMVVDKGLSVRETEHLVSKTQDSVKKNNARRTMLDPNIRLLQDSLSLKLGALVQVQHGAEGRGKLIVHYNTLDELDGILAHIQ